MASPEHHNAGGLGMPSVSNVGLDRETCLRTTMLRSRASERLTRLVGPHFHLESTRSKLKRVIECCIVIELRKVTISIYDRYNNQAQRKYNILILNNRVL